MVRAIKRFLLFGVLPLLLLGGVVAWFERGLIVNWYYLHKLERARGEDVAHWARRTAGLDTEAVPSLLNLLSHKDEQVCANAHAALACLGERWGKTDPRTGELVQLALKDFANLSVPGQLAIVQLTGDWAGADAGCPDCLVCACSRLLAQVQHQGQTALLAPSLELALTVVARSKQPDLMCTAREIARTALTATDAGTRVRAVRLGMHPGIELGKDMVPLLSDPEALVRRAAMLAVRADGEVMPTDTLLHWLHDPDEEVRRLCETALRGPKRGLKSESIRLARLITDPRWEVRLTVVDHLEEAEDLDMGVWLRRLSSDASPPVRAAAIRAAWERQAIDLTDRLDQMAQEDPSLTVANLARHYLRQRRLSHAPQRH